MKCSKSLLKLCRISSCLQFTDGCTDNHHWVTVTLNRTWILKNRVLQCKGWFHSQRASGSVCLLVFGNCCLVIQPSLTGTSGTGGSWRLCDGLASADCTNGPDCKCTDELKWTDPNNKKSSSKTASRDGAPHHFCTEPTRAVRLLHETKYGYYHSLTFWTAKNVLLVEQTEPWGLKRAWVHCNRTTETEVWRVQFKSQNCQERQQVNTSLWSLHEDLLLTDSSFIHQFDSLLMINNWHDWDTPHSCTTSNTSTSTSSSRSSSTDHVLGFWLRSAPLAPFWTLGTGRPAPACCGRPVSRCSGAAPPWCSVPRPAAGGGAPKGPEAAGAAWCGPEGRRGSSDPSAKWLKWSMELQHDIKQIHISLFESKWILFFFGQNRFHRF